MHYTGQVYRHPYEANTPLIEVTAGCSHNKCAFCTMYQNTCFKVSPLEHVEEDLRELKTMGIPVKRINLVNGEPFVLATKKLVEIGELINNYFPEIETITCYTSIKNLKKKSLQELKELRALGFNELHIGLESGYNPAVQQMNKGFTVEEAYENLKKLVAAGYKWDAILMLGVAGRGNGDINVKETAKILNTFPPYMISIMSTSVSPGTPLEIMRDNGEFVEPTEREMIEEEIKLLELIEFEDAFFFGAHNYNLIPVNAELKHKEAMIKHFKQKLKEIKPEILDGVMPRAAMQ